MATDKRSAPMRRAVALAALIAGVSVFEGTASASPTYPDDIGTAWGVKPPFKAIPGKGCQLCHANDKDPDKGKMVTTFVGMYFYDQGLRAALDKTFATLLETSKSEGQDSDGDGVSDYQELVDGTNPNEQDIVTPPPPVGVPDGGGDAGMIVAPPPVRPKPPPKLPPLLETGCSMRAAATRSLDPRFLLALVVAAALCRRRVTSLRRPARRRAPPPARGAPRDPSRGSRSSSNG